MGIYTMEDWSRDHSFSAEIGQEVAPEIYEQMYECMPPLRLPSGTPLSNRLGVKYGFRVGEPYAHAESLASGDFTAFYAAFGKAADGRCYFLGNQNKYGEIFDTATGKAVENK